MTFTIKHFFAFTLLLLFSVVGLHVKTAQAGYAHLIIDVNTGKVLAADHADTLNHPASLTKMMVFYLTFEALHNGRLRWNQKITMTKKGVATVPLKLGVRAGRTFTVREGLNGMVILSANDAAEAIASYLAGGNAKVGKMMTRKAHKLGMTKTVFRNGSGLPDKRQVTTARDMATLAVALMRDFPREYKIFAKRSFVFRGRKIRGHNHLMYSYPGMDGLKTGFINSSGFNMVSSVHRHGKRLIGVVLGGRTSRSRDDRMAALLDAAMSKASSNATHSLLSRRLNAKATATHPVLPAHVPTPQYRPVSRVVLAINVPTPSRRPGAVSPANPKTNAGPSYRSFHTK